MAFSQSEVAQKIRSSIEQKLLDMNVFVDNELPDYIMVLVANKRSKTQMEKDLSLFLGSKTADFTRWLWELVDSFKESKRHRDIATVKSEVSKPKPKMVVQEAEGDVLNLDLNEQYEDFPDPDEEVKSSTKPKIPNAPKLLPRAPPPTVKASKAPDKLPQKSAKVYPIQTVQRTQSVVTPVQRSTKPDKVPTEYDPTKPQIYPSYISSVVLKRKHPRIDPVALQANKILQKAVNEATKSVLGEKGLFEYYQPTPIEFLSKKETTKAFEQPLDFGIESPRLSTSPVYEETEGYTYFESNNNQPSVNIFTQENYIVSDTDATTRTIYSHNELGSPMLSDEDVIETPIFEDEENEQPTHFTVTLDGADFSSFKRKFSFEEDEQPMDIDREVVLKEDDEDISPAKKQRRNEKCKYWPACRNSDNCAYLHPTVPCKNFPDCPFGDKCLYIHPNCKFDSRCSRKDCPFTHASRRKFSAVSSNAVAPLKVKPVKTVCKFYPNCTAAKCPFIHPKLCRFGTQCRAPACPFSHFNVPSRQQMKWKAI